MALDLLITILFNIVRSPRLLRFFFFNDPAPTEIYPLPLHDALPICARLPRRERASRRRTLDGQGQHGDDNRDGCRFVRWPRVRDTHPRRRQQHDVVIVAIVPETGDPRGIGRTGVGQGPCRGERADEEENEETPNAHGWTHTIGLLRVSSDWGCCGRRLRSRSRRRPRRLTRRYATSSGRATMMPVCVGTRARYVASSSSRRTAFWVVDACSNLTVPPASL